MNSDFPKKIEELIGDSYRLQRSVSGQPNESVFIYQDSEERQVQVHCLPQVPQNLRILVEFETSQLRTNPVSFLPKVIASSFDGNEAIIVKEFYDGVSVDEFVAKNDLALLERIAIAKDLFNGLRELEQMGVQHLDLFQRNLLINGEGRAQVVRSRYLPPIDEAEKLESAFCCSPEQSGAIDRDTNAASDLYSAGVLLFLLLAGRYPFPGNSVKAVLLAHMTNPMPDVSRYNPRVPAVLDEIVAKLLQKDPIDRYQTAQAVLHDLDLVYESLAEGSVPFFHVGLKDHRSSIVEPALVGRETELTSLGSSLEAAAQGQNGLLFVEGVSGSGKTRVLFDFARRAVAKGWTVFRGQCIQEASRQSLRPMQGIVERFSYCAQESAYAQRFRAAFDGEWNDLQQLFPDLDLPGIGSATPYQRVITEQRTLQLLSSFISALGSPEQPALVVIDDCQWIDDLTIKLISHWWKNRDSKYDHIAVVLVFRGDEVPDHHPIRKLKPQNHTKLDALSDAEIRLLAESMAGTLPQEVLDFVVTVAGGSPFMASAVVRGLSEHGAITRQGDNWTVNQAEFDRCLSCNKAGEFLTRRLESFDKATLELLSAAAVLGREFELDTAVHLSHQSTKEAIRGINEVRDRNLLWSQGRGNRYTFSHDKIREALIRRLGQARVRDLHRATAEYLMERKPMVHADVAFHFDAAGCPKAALPFAMQAAEESLAKSKFSNAKTQFQIAERSQKHATTEQKYTIQTGLGQVLMERGEYDQVEQYFQNAATYASSDLDNAQALGNIAEIQRRRGDIGDAGRTYRKSLEILQYRLPRSTAMTLVCFGLEIGKRLLHCLLPAVFVGRAKRPPNERERLALRLFSGLSHANANGHGSILQSFYTHVRSINLAEQYQPSPELAVLYLEHAVAWAFVGQLRLVAPYVNRCREIYQDDFPGVREGLISNYLSIGYYCTAKYDDAIRYGRQAIESLERVGDYWKIHMARYQVAASLYQKGYYREAIAEAKRNYESSVEKGDFQASGLILDVWARANPGDVPDEILEAEIARGGRGDLQGTAQLLIAKTANLIGQKRLDEAVETADKARKIVLRNILTTPYPYAILAWSVCALRAKAESLSPIESRRRKTLLKRALRVGLVGVVHSLIQPIETARLFREIGIVLAMQGRERFAKWFLSASMQMALRQGAEFDYAESLRVLGELEVGANRNWAKAQIEEANSKLNRLRFEHGAHTVRRDIEEQGSTISLVDRFDTLLNVGRKIVVALRESDVHQQTRDAALRLLRCEQCVILTMDGERFRIVDGPALDIDKETAGRAFRESKTIVNSSSDSDSVLCAPISVLGQTRICLYATHSLIRNMFGSNEQRLADFIATLAGASLENALGYKQLQELNTTLEDRVAERTQAAESRARELAQSNRELEKTANDLRSTEEQLRSAVTEANAASEAKSRFLATMSHEIRTPMNGILGMAELALATELDATQAKYLKVVKQSGQTLLDLLNDILDLSKIEAGKVEIEAIQFELRDIVQNATQLFSPAAHAKNLEIICDVEPHLPVRVQGDPNRIRQIVVNLIGNAIKFTSEGEIHVSVSQCDDGHYAFAVRDTGIGIAEDKQQAIFEAFQQEDSSTTRKYGGTGLGLSICQQLAELMGGYIQLESVQDVGSTFTLRIPLVPIGTDIQTDIADDQLRGHTAILACDSRSNELAVQRLLECLGVHVLPVDSADVLEQDMVENVDFVVVDEPDDSVISELLRWDEAKLLIMTRSDEARHDDQLILHKPLHLDEVRDTLRIAVNGPRMETTPADAFSHATSGNGSDRPRILVADDCEVNQQVAKGLLEMEGLEVAIVSNGEEAVRAFGSEEYDVILMDVEMPVMDGMQATREIRKTSNIPIFALSAHAVEDLERRCEDVGFSGFISKPVQPEDLMGKINNVLPQRS